MNKITQNGQAVNIGNCVHILKIVYELFLNILSLYKYFCVYN